ncbi:hypothetical protein ZWY2020_052292 [Hordeum vulgare]|nr:hypothetical protein ZWY2020_052292 [Hordeum vulgare]
MSKFATSPLARNLDMSPVLDDAYDATARDAMLDTMPDDAMLDTMPDDAMLDTTRDTMPDTALPDIDKDVMPDTARDAIFPDDAMLDTARDTTLPDVPLGVFLDAHIARVTANAHDTSDTADTIEIEPAFSPARSSSPRYELPDIPEGYVMEGEIAEDFLAFMSKFATSPPARNLDRSPVLDDAYDAMPDTARDAMLDIMPDDAMLDTMPDDAMLDTARDAMLDPALPDDARDAILPDDAMLDTARDTTLPDVPLGVFVDAHIARVTANARDASETTDTIEIEPAFAHARSSSPRYELPDILEGYVMDGEIAEDFLAYRNVNDLKLLSKHASMITTQVEQVLKAQNDLLNELNDNSVRVITRGGKLTQEPLYPESHTKRIDQDSQGINADTPSHPKEKKKDDRNLHASSPNTVTPEEPNDISASNAETQSGDNMDSDVHNNAQPSNDEDVEIEPTVNPDNPQPKKYDKNEFTARKHGKEREPWLQRSMPFPPKPSTKNDDEDFERFVEMIRPIFLQMRLTDMLMMSPYAKYMKDIVTNKRKITDLEISTMLANYTFKGGTPEKLGDPGVPTIPWSIKGNYVRIALCDLGAGVSVMPLSLYCRLELDKLTPTEISLQMADKSTAFPIGICEDVPFVVANITILRYFVILDILEDDAIAVILGRPFFNTAGAVID